MLLGLPDELLREVLFSLDLQDLLNFSVTSKTARAFVIRNDAVWKALMLKTFDKPALTQVITSQHDATADQRLLSTEQHDQLALLMSIHGNLGGTRAQGSSVPASTSSSVLTHHIPSSAARKNSSLREFKRRLKLFLKNGSESRAKYVNSQYRLKVRDQIVSYAIQLLCEHRNKNYNVLAQSQLFSAVIFDQFVPGTIPSLQMEKLPSATAYTLKVSAHILQQRIDMLRLVFGQRLPCSSLANNLGDLQAVAYDSTNFPLFSRAESTETNRAGAGVTNRRATRLSDSAWTDIDVLCDTSVIPNFDVLLAIINFFAHYSDRLSIVRDGLLPFFNSPPDAGDFNFTETDTFQFPRDWTGAYGYLAFWDFDLLRRATSVSPAERMRTQQAQSVAGETVRSGSMSDHHYPHHHHHHPSTMPSSGTQLTETHGRSSTSPLDLTPASTVTPSSSAALPPTSMHHLPNVQNSSFQDQFDGFQVMETDVPPISGPVSFMGRGRDRFDYVTYATLSPLDSCYGLPGFARFGMRKEYVRSEASGEEEDEVVWEYNGVYIPGSKILLGRWRDGTDVSQTDAVEGPFIFYADEL
ncbi:hypothetical protein V1512DRAFT_258070 [Lipomyces arxii]|uniref:uncharacterized protein n=1 Tax=Lipomyces arxii TaxID=56418 RepID=UPI0034CD700B